MEEVAGTLDTLGWCLSQTGEGRSDCSVAEAEDIGRLNPKKANYQCLVLGLFPNLGPTGGYRKDWSLVCVCVCVCSVAQLCSTLYDPMDCSPSGSSVHGIFQARVLEWNAISFPRGSS